MKRIISLLLVLILSLGLFSCSGASSDHDHEHEHGSTEKLVEHFQGGVYFSLPADFVTKNLSYGDYVYTDGHHAYFIVNIYDEVALEEDMYIPKDITVREYAQMRVTDMMCADYKYNEANDSATFEYVYEYNDGSGMPNEYYLFMILRNEEALYQLTLTCDEVDLPTYKDTFNAILKTVSLAPLTAA